MHIIFPIFYNRHYNFTEEAPTFSQALQAQQQVHLLLNHLLSVVHKLKPSTPELFFGPSEEALFCWTLIVAILQLDKEAIISVFSLLHKMGAHLANGTDAVPSPPSSSPLTLLHRILNGIEALERLISANPRAAQEYSSFFTELKPIIWCVWDGFYNPRDPTSFNFPSIRRCWGCRMICTIGKSIVGL